MFKTTDAASPEESSTGWKSRAGLISAGAAYSPGGA